MRESGGSFECSALRHLVLASLALQSPQTFPKLSTLGLGRSELIRLHSMHFKDRTGMEYGFAKLGVKSRILARDVLIHSEPSLRCLNYRAALPQTFACLRSQGAS